MVFTNADRPRAEFPLGREGYVKTLVKRGATLGANCTIVCGVTLGAYCFVGAGAVVTGDVPSHALMVGVPARQRGWACVCGAAIELQDGRAHCDACGRSYTGGAPVGSSQGGLVLEEQ
jgi:UDP-2-acetamido-3-amino-2,3-dideoxy-glucuronate N-acetyltransferase